ncbi:MAG: hypothetical protein KKH94_05230, partial [Candidatus Omnitrophica bacterium]|nr:hypothetical protein [Candidatus Omnitrophota bacterium]
FLNSMNDPKEHERTINEMYDIFADILGLARQNGTKIDADSAVRKIKLKIREILGIEELTKLRERIIRQAIKSI